MLQVTKPWLNTKNCDHTVCNLLNMCSLNKCTVHFVPSKEFLSVCTRSLVHVLCDVLIFFFILFHLCAFLIAGAYFMECCATVEKCYRVFFYFSNRYTYLGPSIKSITTKLGNEFRIFDTHGVLSVSWRVCVSTSVFRDLEKFSLK